MKAIIRHIITAFFWVFARSLRKHLAAAPPCDESPKVAQPPTHFGPPVQLDALTRGMIIQGYLGGEYTVRPKQQCVKCGSFTLVAKPLADSTEFSCLTCLSVYREQERPA